MKLRESGVGPLAAAIVVVLVLGGITYWGVDYQRSLSAAQARPPAGFKPYEPPPTEQPPFAAIAVIGDTWSTGGPDGGLGRRGWPSILGEELAAEVVDNYAVAGASYASGEQSFAKQVTAMNKEWEGQLVIVMGSRNDVSTPTDVVERAAQETLRRVRRAQPAAKILVVGPAWPAQNPPLNDIEGDPARLIEAVRRAAGGVEGAVFVDPMAQPWFSDANSDLIGRNGVDPNNKGHQLISERVETALVKAGWTG